MKDYLHDYFLPSLFNQLERYKNEVSHCCGLCMNWNEYEDSPGYGECKSTQDKGLGFDCMIGKSCYMFAPAYELEVGLHVHDKRVPYPIRMVE